MTFVQCRIYRATLLHIVVYDALSEVIVQDKAKPPYYIDFRFDFLAMETYYTLGVPYYIFNLFCFTRHFCVLSPKSHILISIQHEETSHVLEIASCQPVYTPIQINCLIF